MPRAEKFLGFRYSAMYYALLHKWTKFFGISSLKSFFGNSAAGNIIMRDGVVFCHDKPIDLIGKYGYHNAEHDTRIF